MNTRTAILGALLLVTVVMGSPLGTSSSWGNDRVADWNDAQCDDDEGMGNDWKCESADQNETDDADDNATTPDGHVTDNASHLPSGHAWGHPNATASHDSTCDNDQGFGNDERCEAAAADNETVEDDAEASRGNETAREAGQSHASEHAEGSGKK